MNLPIRNPGCAAVFSFLMPGLGQILGGKPGRGTFISLPAIVLFFVLIPAYVFANHSLVGSSSGLTSLLILDIIGCVYHLYAIVDAYRVIKPVVLLPGIRGIPDRKREHRLEFAARVGVLVATFAVHGAVAYADVNSCTMRNVPCPVSTPPIAAGSPGSSASGVPAKSSGPSAAAGSPSPTSNASVPTTIVWKPIADRLRVHSKPSSDSPTIFTLRQWQNVTGAMVDGGEYPYAGEQHTEWIKIDKGQPGAGGYVAGAYFLQLGTTPLPATPSPGPTSSPSPTATPKPTPSATYTPNV